MSDEHFYFTDLIWTHRSSVADPFEKDMDGNNKRILIFSPKYKENDPMRIRIIDAQFFKTNKDAEWWAYINTPKEEL